MRGGEAVTRGARRGGGGGAAVDRRAMLVANKGLPFVFRPTPGSRIWSFSPGWYSKSVSPRHCPWRKICVAQALSVVPNADGVYYKTAWCLVLALV